MSASSDTTLRQALRANAAFSALCALLLLTASGPLAGWMGAPQNTLLIIGALLVLFVVDLLLTARKSPIPRGKTISFVVMDVLWVVGSAIILLVPTPLTGSGRLVVALVALAVGGLAAAQVQGIRRQPTAHDDRAASTS